MGVPEEYSVISIPSEQTHEWLLKKHYAHRIPSITYAFGLYDKNAILSGVCCFGFPMASELQNACSGKFKVIELNRLVIDHGLEKNTLSYFVGKCLKLLPSPIICVSYADTGMSHFGYIYQATNWIYTGLGAGGWGWAVKGLEHMHHTSIVEDSVGRYEDRGTDKSLEELLKEKYGDRLYKKKESAKHRYFFFCGNRADKKVFLANFKYTQKPYPKGDNQRYDDSCTIDRQGVLFI